VVVGWVLFRSESFTMALGLLRRMFSWTPGAIPIGWPILLAVVMVAAGVAHFCPNTFEISHHWNGAVVFALALLFGACMAVLYGGQQSPFLYFQF
jgi:hypothetical protein